MAVVAVVLIIDRIATTIPSGEARLVTLNVLQIVTPGVATGVAVLRARSVRGRCRLHLWLMAAATAAWTLGQIYWTFAEVIQASGLPFPSLADVGYVAFMAVAALALLTAGSSRAHRTTMLRHALDASAIAASLLFVAWATALHPILESYSGEKAVALGVGVAYPVGDVVLLTVVLVLIVGTRPEWRTSLTLYALSIVALMVADTGFAYLTAADRYATGSLVDAGWEVGFALLALGAWYTPRFSVEQEGIVEPPTSAATIGPNVAFLAALIAAVYTVAVRGEDLAQHPFLGVLAALIFVGVGARAMVARSEAAAYAAQLTAAGAELAQMYEWHKQALDAAAVGTWEWSRATDQFVATARVGHLFGFSRADTVPSLRDVVARVHPDDRARVENLLVACTPAHPEFDLDFRSDETGTSRLRVRGRALFSSDGQPIGVSGVVFDVTEAWLAADSLRRQEAKMTGVASLGARSQRASNADEVFRDVTSTVVTLLPVLDDCALWRLDLDAATAAETLSLVASAPALAEPESVTRPLVPGSVGHRAIQQHKVVVAAGPSDIMSRDQADRPAAPTEIAVAVMGPHGVWGVLSAHDGGQTLLSTHDLVMIQEAANIVGAAVVRQEGEMALWHEARHDPLTALPNRALLLERLAATLPELDGQVVALIMLDLDDFKDVNDRYGHEAGDALLIEVSRRLCSSVRPPDLVARLGGDEFAVLLEDVAGPDDIDRVVSRILESLSRPMELQGVTLRPLASIGWATTVECEPSFAALLRSADLAMYTAKRSGKNRGLAFEPSMFATLAATASLGDELRTAIDLNELVLYYQPQVDLRSGQISGAEALVRWAHPERGVLPPSEFLTTANQIGLMPRITAWAIREACAWAAAHRPDTDGQPFTVAVNITAADLEGPDLPGVVAGALAATGLDASRLCLEVTEAGLIADIPAAVTALLDLRTMGMAMAIDDFGTGYSSLSRLKRLPVDAVKIDQGFIDGLGTELDDSAMVAAIVTMAHNLSLDIVAEGVETTRQLEQLYDLGCEYAQGYLFGRPAPAAGELPHQHVAGLLRQPAPEEPGAERRPTTWTVVIADDLDDDRRLLKRSLTRSGRFTVVAEAADGLGAVRLAQELHPDLVLLDLQMPVMDGWAALRLIHDEVPTADVVLLSGHTSDLTERAATEAGALACILKGSADVVPQLLTVLDGVPVTTDPPTPTTRPNGSTTPRGARALHPRCHLSPDTRKDDP